MIYTAIDKWNSSPDSYLEHHGVKGMKWGVRKQPESLGSRYSRWGRNVSNKSYDRQLSRVEARRARKMTEVDRSPVKNTRYGKWVKDVSNKSYDRQKANIEARRAKRMGEFDNFDKARSKGLTKGQKIAIGVGVGAAVAAGVGVGAYVLKKSGMKPAPLSIDQLKKMGVATFKPETFKPATMKTPVKNIVRGKSTVLKTNVGRAAAGKGPTSFTDYIARNAGEASRNMYASPATRAHYHNVSNFYGATDKYGRYVNTYRPRYVTNRGGAVRTRLR